jgi:hypothetical protein
MAHLFRLRNRMRVLAGAWRIPTDAIQKFGDLLEAALDAVARPTA